RVRMVRLPDALRPVRGTPLCDEAAGAPGEIAQAEGDGMTLADQAARDRIVTDLEATMLVEAAAGTGKTTELVRRIVAVVASGRTTLDRIAAVTYTEKAAGELKLRIHEQIERRRSQSAGVERERLDGALEKLEEARIGTIHSFCRDLLQEHPVEAGID